MYSFCFSIKTCIQLLKDDSRTPLLDINNKPTDIVRYINELIENGIKGILKKESVIFVLQELVVIHNIVKYLCKYKI